MKNKIYILLMCTVGMFFNSCDDDILDKYPLDTVTDSEFWQTENDLQLYLTGLYGILPEWSGGSSDVTSFDLGTDIIIEGAQGLSFTYTNQFDGTNNVPSSGGGWNWGDVRKINYFLGNLDKVDEAEGQVSQYIGEAYFFRAYAYFELFAKFGGLPIIDKVLGLGDDDYLYAPRTSRKETADFILADLERALSRLKDKGGAGAGRINSDIALMFKARVSLYMGTWDKYHTGTVFAGDTDGTAYIQAAAAAAKLVIDGGNYMISMDGGPSNAYYKLFTSNSVDIRDNEEVLLYKHYNDNDYGGGNNVGLNDIRQGMTHQMTEYYLCSDGLPRSVSPLVDANAKLGLLDIEENRDPRFDQTLITRGEVLVVDLDGNTTLFDTPDLVVASTAYELKKWKTDWYDPVTNRRTKDLPYISFRYAEALLIYAEAKEELGEFNQGVADMTVNLLRARVGMPDMEVPVPFTDADWIDYGAPISPELQEIRRERVVELYAEGFRFNDLTRWRAHKIFTDMGRPTGAYLTAEDGIEEIFSPVVVNAEGYIDLFVDVLTGGSYGFNEGRDYLSPLPNDQLKLNTSLTQNPGW
jgi:hypothetical protein